MALVEGMRQVTSTLVIDRDKEINVIVFEKVNSTMSTHVPHQDAVALPKVTPNRFRHPGSRSSWAAAPHASSEKQHFRSDSRPIMILACNVSKGTRFMAMRYSRDGHR